MNERSGSERALPSPLAGEGVGGGGELTYEQALELLDRKLKALEDGDLSLDDALTVVDEARSYLLVCERRLEEARKRIEVRPEGAAIVEDGR
jgi:exodeoxyribonuclease VII small subunit